MNRSKTKIYRTKPDCNVDFIKQIIPASKGFTLFIKYNCPYCQKAMRKLYNAGIPFKIIDIEVCHDMRKNLYEYLEKKYDIQRRTVPQIFWGSRYIGGCDDLLSIKLHEVEKKYFSK